MLEFMCLLRILAPVLDDTAYSGDDSSTPEREEGLYQLYHLSIADGQRGDVSTGKPRASRLSQNKGINKTEAKWGDDSRREKTKENWKGNAKPDRQQNLCLSQPKNVQTGFRVSFVRKLKVSFAIGKGAFRREQLRASPPQACERVIKLTANSPWLKMSKTQAQNP